MDIVFAIAPTSVAELHRIQQAGPMPPAAVEARATLDTISGPTANVAQRTDGVVVQVHGRVAVISVAGIMTQAGHYNPLDGKLYPGLRHIRAVAALADADPDISAIALRIASPGGSTRGLADTGDVIRNLAKPTTAVVDGMAASAAYWLASQADTIIAGRGSHVGNIGAMTVVPDTSEAAAKQGLRIVAVTSGAMKATGTPGTPVTAEQEAMLQALVDAAMADFRAAVLRGRPALADSFDAVADARILAAPAALEAGLIDGIGNPDAVLAQLVADNPTPAGGTVQAARNRLRLATA